MSEFFRTVVDYKVNLPLLLVLPKGSKRKKPTWHTHTEKIRVGSISVNSTLKKLGGSY